MRFSRLAARSQTVNKGGVRGSVANGGDGWGRPGGPGRDRQGQGARPARLKGELIHPDWAEFLVGARFSPDGRRLIAGDCPQVEKGDTLNFHAFVRGSWPLGAAAAALFGQEPGQRPPGSQVTAAMGAIINSVVIVRASRPGYRP